MKDYPSIPSSMGQNFAEIPNALVFDKIDGSSCRSEWSKKRGWYKHGKRHGLIDDSNPHLIQVPGLFLSTLAEPLTKIAHDNRWQELVVFYEFCGTNSIAGLHYAEDSKYLTVFDIAADRKGIVGPSEFRKIMEDKIPTAKFLGQVNWTRGYVNKVRAGEIEGITLEGVVGKAGSKHDIIRAKAKTQKWIDRVIEVHGELAGKKLIES